MGWSGRIYTFRRAGGLLDRSLLQSWLEQRYPPSGAWSRQSAHVRGVLSVCGRWSVLRASSTLPSSPTLHPRRHATMVEMLLRNPLGNIAAEENVNRRGERLYMAGRQTALRDASAMPSPQFLPPPQCAIDLGKLQGHMLWDPGSFAFEY